MLIGKNRKIFPEVHKLLRAKLALANRAISKQAVNGAMTRRISYLYNPSIFKRVNRDDEFDDECYGYCGSTLDSWYLPLKDGRRLCLVCTYYIIEHEMLFPKPTLPPHLANPPKEPKLESYMKFADACGNSFDILFRSFGYQSAENKAAVKGMTERFHIDLAEYNKNIQLLKVELEKYNSLGLDNLWDKWSFYRDGVNIYWPGYPPDWKERRLYVFKRHGLRCSKCGATTDIIVHHVIPITSQQGTNDMSNLIPVCNNCHDIIHHRR